MEWKDEHPAYNHAVLEDKNILPNPWDMWYMWQRDACSVMKYTNEISLATADQEGNPSIRMLLLKHSDEHLGFCWYTNRNSEKGQQLQLNPKAEILWYCKRHQRQVRIRGAVEEISRDLVEKYAQSRPLKSQVSALLSKQSSPLKSKEAFITQFDEIITRYVQDNELIDPNEPIPVSTDWTGYCLEPQRFEFWQGSTERLHDRIIYTRLGINKWDISRLAP